MEGEPGKVWLTLREDGDRRLIGLINLCGCEEDFWNRGKEKPIVQKNLTLRVLTLAPVHTAWLATPDDGIGGACALPCTCRDTELGVEVSVTVPELAVCALVWF